MKNYTKIRVPKKLQGRVEEIHHDSDGYWVYLSKGWCWDDEGLHTIHEDTQKEVLSCLRYTQRCGCTECQGV